MGGKGMIAERIAALLPARSLYLEPFAGSLGVLYARQPARQEIVNDLHQDLVNLYQIMRVQPDEFRRRCHLTPFARVVALSGYKVPADLDPVERAVLFFAYLWQNHGSAGGRSTVSGFTTSSPLAYSDKIDHWADALGRLPAAMQRLARVQIECRDALTLIEKYGKHEDALIYCDPPYLRGGARLDDSHGYKHEFTVKDHARLASALRKCRAAVAVSYYADPRLDKLYKPCESGGKWRTTPIFGARRNTLTGGRNDHAAPEVLITNYDPAEMMPLFATRSEQPAAQESGVAA